MLLGATVALVACGARSTTAVGLASAADGASCRLPVTWERSDSLPGTTAGSGPPGGGFIGYPDGSFQADGTARGATPFGDPAIALWYDRSSSKWLPVAGRQVSLNQSTYIYYTLRKGIEIHAVTVRTGSDIRLAPSQDEMWDPVGLDNPFVYAMVGGRSQATDLWRIPLDGGKASRVTTAGHWIAVSAGSVWGTESAPRTPFLLLRLDLSTGKTTRWGSFDDSAQLLGFDAAGWPVISIGDIAGTVVVKSAPNADRVVATGVTVTRRSPYDDFTPTIAIGDAHGIWLAGDDGIYLSVDGSATKISNVHAFPAGTCG
jgi:hypothetical protein